MKYIKTYESMSEDPINDEIAELLSDITDDGFIQFSIQFSKIPGVFFGIIIYKYNTDSSDIDDRYCTYSWDEVSNTIERLVDNLSDRYRLTGCLLKINGKEQQICFSEKADYDFKVNHKSSEKVIGGMSLDFRKI